MPLEAAVKPAPSIDLAPAGDDLWALEIAGYARGLVWAWTDGRDALPQDRFHARGWLPTPDSLAGDRSWLAESELAELEQLTHPVRRANWLHGRLLGKLLIGDRVSGIDRICSNEIAISTRNEHGESVRPAIRIQGVPEPWSLSISHADGLAMAILSREPQSTIGVDLTAIVAVKPGFLATWFTPREREYLEGAGEREAAVFWAAKESVYKTLNRGERFAPRRVEISRDGQGALCARYRDFVINGGEQPGRDHGNKRDWLLERNIFEHVAVISICRALDGTCDNDGGASGNMA